MESDSFVLWSLNLMSTNERLLLSDLIKHDRKEAAYNYIIIYIDLDCWIFMLSRVTDSNLRRGRIYVVISARPSLPSNPAIMSTLSVGR